VSKRTYVVAGAKSWNRRVFDDVIIGYPGEWHFISNRRGLEYGTIFDLSPRYIFFLHWSWKVPAEIVSNYECVCFHMTDLPYGRGGSPLQNLIVRGHRKTKLTALRMVGDFDAGPVYMKEDLCLEGSAEEIYIRASHLSAKMIRHIIDKEPMPKPQEGEPTVFQRRHPEQSEISDVPNLQDLYDFIRMLDAAGYPRAFLEYRGFRYEFSRAVFYDGRLVADVEITPSEHRL
jgi:methionyl-tRNA formyltransferase